MNITDFLQARIAEDEAIARAAATSKNEDMLDGTELPAGNEWTDRDGMVAGEGEYNDLWDCEGSKTLCVAPPVSAHIARHDPARVLAECAAKRAIIKLAEDVESLDYQVTSEWGGEIDGTADAILQTLADVYKAHPDYRTEWA